MKIIGIVTKKWKSKENHDIDIVYNDIVASIKRNSGIPIGIILEEDYKAIIDICDGLIFQGGDDFEKYDFEALKYAYDKDIPVLGICLGMQLMGIMFDGKLVDINNHKKELDYAHSVKLKRNTKLYNIFESDIIKVNSRHKSVVKSTNLNISGISNDGYIEAIEDSLKKFFIGVQWHPESMSSYDDKQNKLFKYFIDSCNEKEF